MSVYLSNDGHAYDDERRHDNDDEEVRARGPQAHAAGSAEQCTVMPTNTTPSMNASNTSVLPINCACRLAFLLAPRKSHPHHIEVCSPQPRGHIEQASDLNVVGQYVARRGVEGVTFC